MGEIADGMLDGTLCQHCGSYMGEGEGYPRSCCEGEDPIDSFDSLEDYEFEQGEELE